MTTQTYIVEGMTCAHCVRSVTEEVSAVPGVESAVVSLDERTVVITADEQPTEAAVAAAVAEAGYTLAGRA